MPLLLRPLSEESRDVVHWNDAAVIVFDLLGNRWVTNRYWMIRADHSHSFRAEAETGFYDEDGFGGYERTALTDMQSVVSKMEALLGADTAPLSEPLLRGRRVADRNSETRVWRYRLRRKQGPDTIVNADFYDWLTNETTQPVKPRSHESDPRDAVRLVKRNGDTIAALMPVKDGGAS
jgi:hypothetical protein